MSIEDYRQFVVDKLQLDGGGGFAPTYHNPHARGRMMDRALRDALEWIACEGACPISAAILTQRRGDWRDQGDVAVADWSGGELLAYLSSDRRLLSVQLRGDQRRASVSTNLPTAVVQRSAAH